MVLPGFTYLHLGFYVNVVAWCEGIDIASNTIEQPLLNLTFEHYLITTLIQWYDTKKWTVITEKHHIHV